MFRIYHRFLCDNKLNTLPPCMHQQQSTISALIVYHIFSLYETEFRGRELMARKCQKLVPKLFVRTVLSLQNDTMYFFVIGIHVSLSFFGQSDYSSVFKYKYEDPTLLEIPFLLSFVGPIGASGEIYSTFVANNLFLI